jgi:hypothetical protein
MLDSHGFCMPPILDPTSGRPIKGDGTIDDRPIIGLLTAPSEGLHRRVLMVDAA